MEKEFLRTGDHIGALRYALTEYREEASSIVTFLDQPGRLYFVTTNQRIVAAKYADGIALSITALAFGNNPPNLGFRSIDRFLTPTPAYWHRPCTTSMKQCQTVAPMPREYCQASPFWDISRSAIKPLHREGMQCRAISAYRALKPMFSGEIELIYQENKPRMGTGIMSAQTAEYLGTRGLCIVKTLQQEKVKMMSISPCNYSVDIQRRLSPPLNWLRRKEAGSTTADGIRRLVSRRKCRAV